MTDSQIHSRVVPALPRTMVEPIVRAALQEDLGTAGDLTSQALFPNSTKVTARLVARAAGVIAGIQPAILAFQLIDTRLEITPHISDGAPVETGATVLTVHGEAATILQAERTAVNFLQRLSGIASVTHQIVVAIADTQTKLLCTRKTTPNLRALEKHAVLAGGGYNHRFGLYDGILIKDNHLAALDGNIPLALDRAQQHRGPMVRVQIEVDSIDQLQEVLRHGGADAVLLDNMSLAMLTRAVEMVDRQMVTEASGNVTPHTARDIANTGVDYMSSGWVTHSAPALNLSLEF